VKEKRNENDEHFCLLSFQHFISQKQSIENIKESQENKVIG
jgi:hypothetical protein